MFRDVQILSVKLKKHVVIANTKGLDKLYRNV